MDLDQQEMNEVRDVIVYPLKDAPQSVDLRDRFSSFALDNANYVAVWDARDRLFSKKPTDKQIQDWMEEERRTQEVFENRPKYTTSHRSRVRSFGDGSIGWANDD